MVNNNPAVAIAESTVIRRGQIKNDVRVDEAINNHVVALVAQVVTRCLWLLMIVSNGMLAKPVVRRSRCLCGTSGNRVSIIDGLLKNWVTNDEQVCN